MYKTEISSPIWSTWFQTLLTTSYNAVGKKTKGPHTTSHTAIKLQQRLTKRRKGLVLEFAVCPRSAQFTVLPGTLTFSRVLELGELVSSNEVVDSSLNYGRAQELCLSRIGPYALTKRASTPEAMSEK
jgi:hypothetical protein